MKWKHIGERLANLRRKHDLSRVQLGEMIDISAQHLGLVEKGSRGLSVESIVKICDTMGVSADYLLFGASDPAEATAELDGLSHEQIELVLDIIKKVAQFVNSEGGNEALIRELLRHENPSLV